MKEFEIFRAGQWTSDKGITKNYTEDDLQKIVDNYNSEDPAPIVIGHPQTNAPAYGWIESIKKVADRLIAVPKQLNEKFVDLVKNGSFKKRSISLSPDFKLNHVGFLGAAAPAVEGLKEIQFASDVELDNYSLDVDEEVTEESEEVEEETIEEVTEETTEEIKADTKAPLKVSLDASASNKNFQKSLDELKSIVSSIQQNFSQLSDDEIKKVHSRINELQFSMQVNDFELRLNEKLAYGSLTPAMKTKIMNVVSFLQKQNFSQSDFSQAQYLTEVKQLLLEFVESIPKIIYYENFAEKSPSLSINEDEFNDYTLDDDSLLLHRKALQYMRTHEGAQYVEAINILANQ
jgi:hypothetical protein